METFTENLLGWNFPLYFTLYLSIALPKILPHPKTIKNAMKLLGFGKSNLAVYLILNKHIFFGSLIIFLEATTKLVTGDTIPFLYIFLKEDPHLSVLFTKNENSF